MISTEIWNDVWKNHLTTTLSLGWREFLWKNQTRYFITPLIKSKQLMKEQMCWCVKTRTRTILIWFGTALLYRFLFCFLFSI